MGKQVEKLIRAKLLKRSQLARQRRRQEHEKRIERLSDAEVRALISIKRKLHFRGTLHDVKEDLGGVL
jgi:hypothetical protein